MMSNMNSSSDIGFCSRRALTRAPFSITTTLRTITKDFTRYDDLARSTPTSTSTTSTSHSLQLRGALLRSRALYDFAPTTQRLPIIPLWLSRRLEVE